MVEIGKKDVPKWVTEKSGKYMGGAEREAGAGGLVEVNLVSPSYTKTCFYLVVGHKGCIDNRG